MDNVSIQFKLKHNKSARCGNTLENLFILRTFFLALWPRIFNFIIFSLRFYSSSFKLKAIPSINYFDRELRIMRLHSGVKCAAFGETFELCSMGNNRNRRFSATDK